MKNVTDATFMLIDSILDSNEYKQYDLARKEIEKEPELKTLLDEYRAERYNLQNEKDCSFEKVEAFEREYSDVVENEKISAFLSAELAFCRMMQKVSTNIADALNFE